MEAGEEVYQIQSFYGLGGTFLCIRDLIFCQFFFFFFLCYSGIYFSINRVILLSYDNV